MSEMDLRSFLEEDIGTGDVTTDIFVPDIRGSADIVCEEDAVVAGLEEAASVFGILGVTSERLVSDGESVRKNTEVMTVEGPLRGILSGERVALNFLMRMSGIATATDSVMRRIRETDPVLTVAGTRKTTPGFRAYEKKAVALGGGWPHRNGLYDMVMLKDNHIKACGGIGKALELAKKVPEGIKIEIEVENISDGVLAAALGADMIMADHMPPSETKELMKRAKAVKGDVLIEASGNITKDNVTDFAGCADIVSLGSLTHSVTAVHFSLDLKDKT